MQCDCDPKQGHTQSVLASHSSQLISYRLNHSLVLGYLLEDCLMWKTILHVNVIMHPTKWRYECPTQTYKRKRRLQFYCCRNTYSTSTSKEHRDRQVTAETSRLECTRMIIALPQFYSRKSQQGTTMTHS